MSRRVGLALCRLVFLSFGLDIMTSVSHYGVDQSVHPEPEQNVLADGSAAELSNQAERSERLQGREASSVIEETCFLRPDANST